MKVMNMKDMDAMSEMGSRKNGLMDIVKRWWNGVSVFACGGYGNVWRMGSEIDGCERWWTS